MLNAKIAASDTRISTAKSAGKKKMKGLGALAEVLLHEGKVAETLTPGEISGAIDTAIRLSLGQPERPKCNEHCEKNKQRHARNFTGYPLRPIGIGYGSGCGN